MGSTRDIIIDNFYAISLSFNKADVKVRGKFTLFLEDVPAMQLQMEGRNMIGFALSTCNRSELYAFAEKEEELIDLYCNFCKGEKEEFIKYTQIYKGKDAVNHLFRVSAGLESQILGDFEVISQIKLWYQKFYKNGMNHSGLERLIQTAQKISKKVKTETSLSDGITSVSYAAANYIITNVEDLKNKKILLLGTGKIGQYTCDNLVKHVKPDHIYLINRTLDKAIRFGEKHHVHVRPFEALEKTLDEVEVVIVATGASSPVLTAEMVKIDKSLLILDLSIPENVSLELAERENIDYQNVDQISKIINKTLSQRSSEIPKAETIIRLSQWEYMDWLESRKHIPKILAFKDKLELIKEIEIKDINKKNQQVSEGDIPLTNRLIQKLSNYVAFFMKENPDKATQALDLIQEIFMTEPNKKT